MRRSHLGCPRITYPKTILFTIYVFGGLGAEHARMLNLEPAGVAGGSTARRPERMTPFLPDCRSWSSVQQGGGAALLL